MNSFAPEKCHNHILSSLKPSLAFEPDKDFGQWRSQAKQALLDVLGTLPEKSDLNIHIEYEKEHSGYKETRFVFTSEPHADVPCHLLIPQAGQPPYPAVICLQGHMPGMHLSLGRAKYDGDEDLIKAGDKDYALQAVRHGYAALVMEQRCFGERKDCRPEDVATFGRGCHHASMAALLLGRTMIGERVWDVSRAIDALAELSNIDIEKIGCMGNSGGGTITYFAACIDERIRIAMPSCYVCTWRESISQIDHCEDNYLPGALRYFDLPDLTGLIAPRPMVIVAGRKDTIFPIGGVEKAFKTIRQIYAAAGVPDKCRLVIGEEGHRFYADMSWPVFKELSSW